MKKKVLALAMLIMILQIAFYVFWGYQKVDFHVDEYYTYQLANSELGPWWVHRLNEWQPTDESLAQMTVRTADAQFQFSRIVEKQKSDLHPFLYSILINIACSVVRMHNLSVWPGIAINIIFSLGIFVASIYVANKIVQDETASVIIATSIVFSYGVVNMVMFIRMYTMQIFVALCVTVIHSKYWNKKFDLTGMICLYIVSVIGALTHYHFIVYLFFSSLVFGIYMLINKRFKESVIYIFTELLAGITVLMIFPVILNQLFTENASTTMENDPGFIVRFQQFISIIVRELFGNVWVLFFACSVMSIIIVYEHYSLKKEAVHNRYAVSLLCGIVIQTLCYLVFVVETAPYFTSRYIAIIYPGILICFSVAFYFTLRKVKRTKRTGYIVFMAMMVIVTVFPYLTGPISNLYLDRKQVIDNAQMNSDKRVVLVTDYNWVIPYNYCELENYGEFFWTTKEDITSLEVQNALPQDDFMLYLFNWPESEGVLSEEEARHILSQKYENIDLNFAWETRMAKVYMCDVSD